MRSPPPPPRAVPSLFSGTSWPADARLPLVPSTIFRSSAARSWSGSSPGSPRDPAPRRPHCSATAWNALRIPFFGRAAEHAGREGRFWARSSTGSCAAPSRAWCSPRACCSRSPRPCSRSKRARRGRRRCSTASSRSRLPPSPRGVSRGVDRAGRDRGRRKRSRGRRGRRSRPARARARAPADLFGEATVEANGEAGTVARVTVLTAGNPDGQDAIEAVRELRSEVVPRAFAGVDAEVMWRRHRPRSRSPRHRNFWLPLVLVFVLALSSSARPHPLDRRARDGNRHEPALGRSGHGLLGQLSSRRESNELLGLREAETIDAWVPLFLFAAVRLSMDYQVFLLSRIRERYAQTADTDAAISLASDRLLAHHRRRADHHRRLLGLCDGGHDRLSSRCRWASASRSRC